MQSNQSDNQNLKLGGIKYQLRYLHGTILEGGANKWVETHIESSGGGGFTHISDGSGFGYTSPVKIKSTNVVNQEFWVLSETGEETPIQLSNTNIPLRAGQQVTVVMAVAPGASRGYWVMLVNKSSGQHFYLPNIFELNTLPIHIHLFIPLILAVWSAYDANGNEFTIGFWAFLIFGIFFYYWLANLVFYSPGRARSYKKALQTLNEVAQKIY